MMSRHMIEEYRRMNSGDRTTFRRWLTLNTLVGAFLLTLIAITAIFWGGESSYQIPLKTVEQYSGSKQNDAAKGLDAILSP